MPNTHLVLIHGAYHRAWHLRLLSEQLEAGGYAVSSIDLPSAGEQPPANGGLEMDTAAVRRAIEQAATVSERVIPVFHSYAGFPGSEAVAQLDVETSKKIAVLIYLAALIPDTGVSPSDARGGKPSPWSKWEGDAVSVPEPIPAFYHDVEPELAKEAASRLMPQSRSTFITPAKHAGWKLFPSVYILCSDDRAVSPRITLPKFAAMSEADRAHWTFFTIKSGHSPFLSQPGQTARLIRKIAGEDLDVDAQVGLVAPSSVDDSARQ